MAIASTRQITSAAGAGAVLSIGDKLQLTNHMMSGPLREGLDPAQVQKCLRLRANMMGSGMWGVAFGAMRGAFGLGAIAGTAYGVAKLLSAESFDKDQWRELAAPFVASVAVGSLMYLPNLFFGIIRESVQNDINTFTRECAGSLPEGFVSVDAPAESPVDTQQRVGVSAEVVYKAALLKPFKAAGHDILNAVKDGLAPAAFAAALALAVAVAVETGNTAPLQRVLAR